MENKKFINLNSNCKIQVTNEKRNEIINLRNSLKIDQDDLYKLFDEERKKEELNDKENNEEQKEEDEKIPNIIFHNLPFFIL
jgi:hypothetical protein